MILRIVCAAGAHVELSVEGGGFGGASGRAGGKYLLHKILDPRFMH